MKEEYKNNDPEKLVFKKALNDLKIEPSEKFWNSALHGIIDKEAALYKGQVKTWKLVSAGLAIVITAFCVHEVVLYGKMDRIEQQVSELKNTQKEIVLAASSRPAAIEPQNNNASQQVASVSNGSETKHDLQASKKVFVSSDALLKPNVVNSVLSQNLNAAEHGNSSMITSNHTTAAIQNNGLLANSGSSESTRAQTNTNTENQEIQAVGSQNNKQDSNGNGVNTITNENSSVVPQAKDVKQDSAITNTAEALPPIEGKKKAYDLSHKLSVSAFFTPGVLSSQLRDNDNNDGIYTSDVSSRESGDLAWQAGFKIGIDMGKFTLYTGLYYNNYSYDIKSTILTAQQFDNGILGYSIVTSSGVINIDCSTISSSTHPGDSLKIHGSTTRSYVCIPLDLRYLFANYKKFDFFADAGISANVASSTNTTINWEDSRFEEGNVSISSIEGLQKVQYGYSLGIGVNYQLSKHFLIYLEPVMRGSITSISKDVPVSNYPLFFGSSLGLTYHF